MYNNFGKEINVSKITKILQKTKYNKIIRENVLRTGRVDYLQAINGIGFQR